MKSLEKLRGCTFIGAGKVDEYIDEIEREIAERYMELPVDADGVPVRIGDVVESYGEEFNVRGICENSWGELCVQGGKHNAKIKPSDCRHVKQRTLESVLQEYGSEIADSASKPWSEIVDKYAAEIRELLDGEEVGKR